jgi:amino acid adenylation domain-containing protein
VAEQAARTPDAPALSFGARAVTYAELDASASRLAHHLLARGAGPETVVGIVTERVPETAVAMLAVLKAGAAYLPLDPAYPADRLAYMLADSGARLVVAPGGLPASLRGIRQPVVDLRDEAAEIAARSADAPALAADADRLAYVVYTSGSTGRPKGVAVTHRGVRNLAAWKQSRLGQRAGDRALQFASFSFDAAVEELFGALLTGSTLVMAERDALMPGEPLRQTLVRERVTFATLPPTALAVMEPAELPDLRVVVSAGDALPAAVAARWADAVELHNAYGPSEATVSAASARVAADGRVPAIGRPLDNVRAYVLDGGGLPLPAGVPGELHVGGAGLARGYLGRPALTAERFVPDPFSGRPGARLYRTGDRARWRADGTLEFVGRLDAQVKIRGFRIEPGEVESALSAHPEVVEARVLVREDAPGEKRLVAYVVGRADADALRAHLRRGLPEYMVPAAFVPLDRLPLTPNGKVDADALPAPEYASAQAAYVEPRTPLEKALAGILADVLEAERVGATDNFFELGGHSLLAVLVVTRVREVLGVELPLNALFDGPTPAQLAESVEALRRPAGAEAADPSAAPIPPAPRDRPLPLSYEQQRLWFIQQMDPSSAAYNLPVVLPLPADLDEAALERTLAELVARHEVLRTTYPAGEDGQPVQVVGPAGAFTLGRVTLEGLEGDARAERVRQLVREEAGRPFDLARGPMVRSTLVRLGEGEHVLLFTLHHISSDGASMEVLSREVSALYGAFAQGRPSPLAPPALQYADYAAWQRAWLSGDVLDGELGWWKGQLEGVPELLELPTDRPRPPVASHRGAAEAFELPEELAGALRTLAQREGCTLFMVLVAGLQALLGRYSGQDDVVVGTTVANRTRREVEALVGLFMNAVALRGDLSGDPEFRALLARVRAATLGAYEHQGVPFERVVEAVRPERTLSHDPVFQVLFELHAAPRSTDYVPGAGRKPVSSDAVTAKYDLTFVLFEQGDEVAGVLQYATDLFDRETAARLVEHYRALLESAVADPATRLSGLRLLRDGERARVVDEWNRTERPYPHVCIHELFEAQARATPEAVAVVFGEERLTYGELDARANQVAHFLRRRGAGPEDRVALCMERGLDLMASFFGILKSGAAYVPLDPTHPAERLGYMLQDSGARLLLTQSWLEERLPESVRGSRKKTRKAAAGGALLPELLFVDALRAEIARAPEDRPESGVTPENLAYVYYTSGSTGRPKGVAMHHYGPANYFAWGREAYRAAEGHGAPVFSSMAVDLTLANFIPLFCGERVELLPEGPGVEALAEAIRRAPGFSMIKITPTHLTLLNGALGPDEAAASTGTLVIGADNLMAEPTLFWRRHAPGVRLLNEYGPTETVVGCSLFELEAGAKAEGRIPIGRPIDNLTMYVLDAHLRPLPVGVPGELYIGGVGVARGYLGRPALTAEKFVPDPFAAAPGARFYRTGDRARFLADGNIEFLGRVDFQVKIRGYRIETGEIESVLTAHAGVRDAMVVPREDVPGDRRLVAYVVPAEADAATADDLRAALRERLPEYMVPAAFVFLPDGFPVGSTGKVDRKTLPAPDAQARGGEGYAAPSTAAERALAAIWEEVLGVSPVGVDDDFFALGGHSMLAVRLMSQVRRQLDAELPLSALFERPTVRRLAPLLEGGDDAPAWSPLVAIQPEGERVPLFFVHPIGGQVLCYVDLARALGPDQPFYGLQAPDLTQVGDEEVTLEQMAAQYIQAIRAVRPHGPYLLGGWSFGGMVAFEMAQQLAAAGESVPVVAILDTASPEGARRMAAMEESVVLASLACEEALKAGTELTLTAAELRPLDRAGQVARTLEALREAGVVTADVDPEWVIRLLQGHRARNQAMARYAPDVYPGALTLFRPAESLEDPDAPSGFSDPSGWRPYSARPLRVETVPGYHATMGTGPQAGSLAERLRAAVDEALSA